MPRSRASTPYAYVCCWCKDMKLGWHKPQSYRWVWDKENDEQNGWQPSVLLCAPCNRTTWRDCCKLEPWDNRTMKEWRKYVLTNFTVDVRKLV